MLSGGQFAAQDITVLPVDGNGIVELDALKTALAGHDKSAGLPLVAIQAANNETGVIQPIAEIAAIVKAAGGVYIVDAVQAAGGTGPVNGYAVQVVKTVDPGYDFASVLDRCRSVTLHDAKRTIDGTVERLTVTGTRVPVDAAVARFNATGDLGNGQQRMGLVLQAFRGVVRGTTVEVGYIWGSVRGVDVASGTPDADAVELFNKQVDKINAAA